MFFRVGGKVMAAFKLPSGIPEEASSLWCASYLGGLWDDREVVFL